jgi:hypothetical protein
MFGGCSLAGGQYHPEKLTKKMFMDSILTIILVVLYLMYYDASLIELHSTNAKDFSLLHLLIGYSELYSLILDEMYIFLWFNQNNKWYHP